MKKKLPLNYLILFVVAIGLLAFTTVNGARAALTIFSPDYVSDFEMYHIGITLNEENVKEKRQVGWRNYTIQKDSATSSTGTWVVNEDIPLFSDIPENGLVIGKQYSEKYTVTNSGKIDEYVRVKVYKYWATKNADGTFTKDNSLDPALIVCTLDDTKGWIIDKTETTAERTILYFNKPITIGEETPAFMTNLTIKADVNNHDGKPVKETKTGAGGETYTKITYVYPYDGKQFVVEMEADAVQTHNAVDAIRSAWGRKVSIDESSKVLTLQ